MQEAFPIIFRKLDTRATPLLAEPGLLATLQDLYCVRAGEYVKRPGGESLVKTTTAGTISNAAKLSALDAAPFLQTQDACYSYSGGLAKWVRAGALTMPTVQVTGLGSSQPVFNGYTGSNINRAVIYAGGYVFHAWARATNAARTTADLYYEVIDYTTGQHVVPATLLRTGTGYGVSCIKWAATSSNSRVCLFYADVGGGGSNATLFGRTISTATPTSISAETTIATDLLRTTTPRTIQAMGTNGSAYTRVLYDVRPKASASSSTIAFAYSAWVAGVIQTRVGDIDSATLAIGTNAYNSDAAFRSLAILDHDWANGNTYLAVSSDGGGVFSGVQIWTHSSSGVRASTDVIHAADHAFNIAGYFSSGTKTIWYDVCTAGLRGDDIITKKATYSGAATVTTFVRSLGVASHVFTQGGTRHLVLSHDSRLQRTYFVYDETGNVVARFLAKNAEGHPLDPGSVVSPSAVSSGVWLWGCGRAVSIAQADGGTYYAGIVNALAKFTFGDSGLGRPVQIGSTLQIPGGNPMVFDGASVTEADFHMFPETPTATTGGGGSVDSGTHKYVSVYAWTDARGNTYRSSPSFECEITSGANATNTLALRTLRVTGKTGVTIEVYRNRVGGTVWYLVGGAANDTSADTVTFLDTSADATIATNSLLYTTGNVLRHSQRPACKAYAVYKNRLFALGCETQEEFWWSKELAPSEGIAFNDSVLNMRVSGAGGLTAAGVIDDKLILLKANEMHYTFGEGPDDLGQGAFTTPQQLPFPIGTTIPDGVLQTQDGLMFAAALSKGVWLLDRGLSCAYAGADVEAFNAYTVTGGLVHATLNQARWYTSNGTTLVYDWSFQQWYTWTNQAASSCANVNGTPHWVASDGTVRREISTQTDDGAAVLPVIVTHPISPAGLRGWARLARVQAMCDSRATHRLKMTITAEVDGQSLAEVHGYDVTGAGYERIEASIANQQATSYTIRLEEETSSGVSGAKFQGLTLLVELQQGLHRLSSTYRSTPA